MTQYASRAITGNESKREGVVAGMDWDGWRERLALALGPDGKGQFKGLFAPGAVFSDPVNKPTSDLGSIEEMTDASFPDWRQEILSVFGDDRGGVFEWIGRGTLGGSIPIEIHGSTVVEVNSDGLVTRWKDYFDLKEIEEQVNAHTKAGDSSGA